MSIVKTLGSALVARLKEKSTWAVILGALTSVGVYVNPELQDGFINVGIAVASVIGTYLAATPDTAGK